MDLQHSGSRYNIPEDIADFIPGYIERRDQDLIELKAFLQARNYEAIGRIAHKIKGNGASFGFDKLTELGLHLQNSTQEQNFERTQDLIFALDQEIRSIKENLKL